MYTQGRRELYSPPYARPAFARFQRIMTACLAISARRSGGIFTIRAFAALRAIATAWGSFRRRLMSVLYYTPVSVFACILFGEYGILVLRD